MSTPRPHPAIQIAIDALGGASTLTTVATAERDGAVAVVLEDPHTRYVVIVERREDIWIAPTMLSGTPWNNDLPRPATTTQAQALQQRASTQSGWPGPDGKPPAIAWWALTGTAALDAARVVATSEIDDQTVHVRDDGLVLALLLAPWRATPTIYVHTIDGRITAVAP